MLTQKDLDEAREYEIFKEEQRLKGLGAEQEQFRTASKKVETKNSVWKDIWETITFAPSGLFLRDPLINYDFGGTDKVKRGGGCSG